MVKLIKIKSAILYILATVIYIFFILALIDAFFEEFTTFKIDDDFSIIIWGILSILFILTVVYIIYRYTHNRVKDVKTKLGKGFDIKLFCAFIAVSMLTTIERETAKFLKDKSWDAYEKYSKTSDIIFMTLIFAGSTIIYIAVIKYIYYYSISENL